MATRLWEDKHTDFSLIIWDVDFDLFERVSRSIYNRTEVSTRYWYQYPYLEHRYNNCISLSDMLGESVFSLNLWLNPKCGKQPEIDISLMMCNYFFVIFQETIGIDVLVSMSEYLFLLSFLYNRCCCGLISLLLLEL